MDMKEAESPAKSGVSSPETNTGMKKLQQLYVETKDVAILVSNF